MQHRAALLIYDDDRGAAFFGDQNDVSPFPFLVFADGVARSLEELFGYFLPPFTMPSTDHPAEYTSALDEHMEGQPGQGALSGGGFGGPDTVVGTGGSDRLYGGDGADTLTGGSGNDIVLAGGGNDLIVAGQGDDYENGGSGRDTLSAAETTAGVTVDLEAGTASGSEIGSDVLSSIENVVGGAGNDHLIGDAVANRLEGGGGNDMLDGGLGSDTLIGGQGDDSYVIDSTSDVIVEEAGAGTDTVIAALSYTISGNLENLELRGGAVSGTGSAVANAIVGNGGANILKGLGGADTLKGGAGADTLVGGEGNDVLTGGAGTDRFEFKGGEAGRDTILDFTRGEDRIVLTDFGLDILQAGVNFMVDAGPSAARATLLYQNSTGVLSLDSDGIGAAAAVDIARLSPNLGLSVRDFVVLETM